MKKTLLKYVKVFYLLVLLSADVSAQQLPAADLYFNNVFFFNPATAGDAAAPRFALLNRRQWVNIEGAPITSFAALDMPIKNKLGIGVNLIHDQAHYLRNIKGALSLRYKLKLSTYQFLALGIQASVYDTYLNFANVKAEEYTDDILMLGNANKALALGADFGLSYKNRNLEIGAFHAQLFNNSAYSYFKSALNSYRLQAHYGGYVLYRFALNKMFDLQPRLGVRYLPGVYLQADAGAMLEYKNKIALALTYRTKETVAASMKYKINEMFSFAYSYGYGVHGIANYSGGTHEVMLQIVLKTKEKEEMMARKVDSLGFAIQELQDKNKRLDSTNVDLEKRVKKLEEMQVTYLDSIAVLRLTEIRIKTYVDSIENAPKHLNKGERYVIENIHFEFNSAVIKKESETTLDNVVKYLQVFPDINMEVDGHTDAIGSNAANQKLSLDRAKAVVKYLTEHGVDASRLSYKGYGEEMPVDTNSTEIGRARNRRIEFIIR